MYQETRRVTRKLLAQAMADEVTEEYAAAMEETIESATKAEAERAAALARVAELEAKYEPSCPVGNTPIHIVSGRAYFVKVCTEEGNYWEPRVAGESDTNDYGDDVAFMYDSEVYATGDCIVLFVKRHVVFQFDCTTQHFASARICACKSVLRTFH